MICLKILQKRHKKLKTKTKTLHSRNLHNSNYDFNALIISEPKLKEFVGENKYGNISIDFANPKAVFILNNRPRKILKYYTQKEIFLKEVSRKMVA